MRPRFLATCAVGFAVHGAAHAQEADCRGLWEGFGLPGVSTIRQSINPARFPIPGAIPWNHDADDATPTWLIVGGVGPMAGNVMANNYAVWDGSAWRSYLELKPPALRVLGAGRITVDPLDGKLWEVFSAAVHVRNPTSGEWTSRTTPGTFQLNVGSGFASMDNAAVVHEGAVYAIGRLNSPSQPPRLLVLGNDGWSVVASIPGAVVGYHYSVFSIDQDLYVARSSSSSSWSDVFPIAWKLAAGQLQPVGTNLSGVGTSQLMRFQGELYAATTSQGNCSGSASSLLRLAGNTWSVVPDACLSWRDFLVRDDGIYFTRRLPSDQPMLMRWNGTSVENLPSPNPSGYSFRLLDIDQNLIAVSVQSPTNLRTQDLRLRRMPLTLWRDGMPEAMGEGFNAPVNALCMLGDQLIAAGEFSRWSDVITGSVAAWNGTQWQPVAATPLVEDVRAMIEFNGQLIVLHPTSSSRLVNGQWQSNAGFEGDAIAELQGDLYTAAGNVVKRYAGGATPASVVMEAQGSIYQLRTVNDQLLVLGDFVIANGVETENVAIWNGSAVQGLPGRPAYEWALDAAEYRGQLYVQGARSIRRFDGLEWTDVAYTSFHRYDARLLVQDDRLYSLGGAIYDTGTGHSTNAAWYDGDRWHAMCGRAYVTESESIIDAIFWNDQLHVAGDFIALYADYTSPATQGQRDAAFYARWTPPPACDPIDFNNDGTSFDPTDIDAFLSVFSEGPCIPAGTTCNDIDFNNDCSLYDPDDIDAFMRVFSEGTCLP